MMDMSPYTCVQTHRTYNAKSEPPWEGRTSGDYDVSLQARQLYHTYRSGGDAEAVHVPCTGAGGTWEPLYLPLNFAVNLELL